MCPLCLTSIAMLVSGGAFSAWLVASCRRTNKENHDELAEDRLA